MFTKLSVLFGRAKYILKDEGAVHFIGLAFSRLRRFVYSDKTYYYYEKELTEQDEFDFTPKIPGATLEIIRTPEQFDELVDRGYRFGSWVSKQLIGLGAIAFCVFVQRELCHITLAATTAESKKYVDPFPFKVDFHKGEVCIGNGRTSNKYRGQGLFNYMFSRLFHFLREEGKTTIKFTITINNIPSQNEVAKFNPKRIKLRYIRVFERVYVKVIPLADINNSGKCAFS